MHDHNNDNKDSGHSGMLWMMIPCLLLLGVLFLGGAKLPSSGSLWPFLIGGFVLLHVWMMFKGHGHGKSDATKEKQDGSDEHKHSGSCH